MSAYHAPADGRFIRFRLRAPAAGRTTPTVEILSRKHGTYEGEIRWKGRRGFALWPAPGSCFGPVCLGDVQRVIRDLMADHERAHLATSAGSV